MHFILCDTQQVLAERDSVRPPVGEDPLAVTDIFPGTEDFEDTDEELDDDEDDIDDVEFSEGTKATKTVSKPRNPKPFSMAPLHSFVTRHVMFDKTNGPKELFSFFKKREILKNGQIPIVRETSFGGVFNVQKYARNRVARANNTLSTDGTAAHIHYLRDLPVEQMEPEKTSQKKSRHEKKIPFRDVIINEDTVVLGADPNKSNLTIAGRSFGDGNETLEDSDLRSPKYKIVFNSKEYRELNQMNEYRRMVNTRKQARGMVIYYIAI